VTSVRRTASAEIGGSIRRGKLTVRKAGHVPLAIAVACSSVSATPDAPVSIGRLVPAHIAGGQGVELERTEPASHVAADLVADRPASDAKAAVERGKQGSGLAAKLAKDADLAHQPEVLRYLALTDEKALRDSLPRGTIAEPFAYEPEWLTGPNGLPVLRFASSLQNQRLISWFLHFAPQEEVYGRYCILIEDDVADGMNELGVKLPGLAGGEVSWRMEHGPVSLAGRGLYAARDYIYAADTGAGYGQIRSMNSEFKAGVWYVIEQYVKLNTPGEPDGVGKVWINGQLAWQSDSVRYRDKAASRIDHMHVNVYHGGMGLPKGPMHYRIAAIAIAKAYIGPPPELIGVIAPEPMLPRTSRARDRPSR
jgi:hypothetical protein